MLLLDSLRTRSVRLCVVVIEDYGILLIEVWTGVLKLVAAAFGSKNYLHIGYCHTDIDAGDGSL